MKPPPCSGRMWPHRLGGGVGVEQGLTQGGGAEPAPPPRDPLVRGTGIRVWTEFLAHRGHFLIFSFLCKHTEE